MNKKAIRGKEKENRNQKKATSRGRVTLRRKADIVEQKTDKEQKKTEIPRKTEQKNINRQPQDDESNPSSLAEGEEAGREGTVTERRIKGSQSYGWKPYCQ